MEEKITKTLFALLRSAILGNPLTAAEKAQFSHEMLPDLMKLAKKHDLLHLVGVGIQKNSLIEENSESAKKLQQTHLAAVFRYEKLNYELKRLSDALEQAQIPFIPLKGSVLRQYYPEPWMRTSCDIDVLVHREDLDSAIDALVQNLQYTKKGSGSHDVSLFSPSGVHIELHFDLAEEGYADQAVPMLRDVWDNVTLTQNCKYRLEMTDAFFYFYHIIHMVQHMETGGCGIRPFVDLWILDHLDSADHPGRDELLSRGKLLAFVRVSRKLSRVWLCGDTMDDLTMQMQSFILHGGVYGSSHNRVAILQKRRGGRLGYLFSRVFAPYDKLKRYYPILEKYRFLMPLMQVRRWFMLARPEVAGMAKSEITANSSMDQTKAEEMRRFLDSIGL